MQVDKTPTAQNPPTPKKYKWKGNKKQRDFIRYWTDPSSETFGNAYRSGIKAGFAHSYSMNITNLAPSWLSESIEKIELDPFHIKQGITKIATGEINSRSVDDTRLKAYELLGKYAGLDNSSKGNTTNILVQPILNGQSVTDTETKRTVVDIDPPTPK